MKKRSVSGALTILLAFAFVSSHLPTDGSLNAHQQASLTDALTKACHCAEPPSPPDSPIRTVIAPELNPTILPVDVSTKKNSECLNSGSARTCQTCFNCFAWQLFIALNWPAASFGEPDPTAGFGLPDNSKPVVWETFKSVDDIFAAPNLEELPAWEQTDGPHLTTAALHKKPRRTLQSDNNWLTDQQGSMVCYEIRVNQDEYQYIRRNRLHNQEGIYDAFTKHEGIKLPDGPSQDGKYGAIEIKAAWRLVPKDKLDEYKKKYKISYAKNHPSGDIVPMALVGLHIIKKTPNSPQFVWATFEHQDNAPDMSQLSQDRQWSFYDRSQPIEYIPNWSKPPKRGLPKNVPVQVIRVHPIREESTSINKAVHDLIADRFSQSVWLNYFLVDVQWPFVAHKTFDVTQKLPAGDPIPASVANTTMETYMQEKNMGGHGPGDRTHPNNGPSSCIGCHRVAAITPSFAGKAQKKSWWTDYSTIFSRAKAKDPAG